MNIYNTKPLVHQIHATPTMAVMLTTGGGTEVFPMLLKPGGGSATVLFGGIPYATKACVEAMGGKPDKFVSLPAARALAMRAFQDALRLRPEKDTPVVGIGATSVLQRLPDERLGRVHLICVALQTDLSTTTWDLIVYMNSDDTPEMIRDKEETLVAYMMLNALAAGCGIEDRIDLPWVTTAPSMQTRTMKPDTLSMVEMLSEGAPLHKVLFECTEDYIFAYPAPPFLYDGTIFPGSFNPLSPAHMNMHERAEAITGRKCAFELSILNADKPAVDFISLYERLKTFQQPGKTYYVWVTNAPLFVQKAELFQFRKLVAGFDTVKRLVDPKYGRTVRDVVAEFQNRDMTLLVFGRVTEDGFENDLSSLPPEFAGLCTVIEDFRMDISSTELRKQKLDI